MQFLKLSRFTEPTTLRLLDAAYITVMMPLLLVIKIPMILYMVVVFFLLLLSVEMTNKRLLLIFIFGIFTLFLSLYGAFNFSGLSRLKIFIELLVYILILAITLQRLTRKINFYLWVSPILLLALSLFFFHSIAMLIYVVLEVFVLLWLIMTHRMQGNWRDTLRITGMLYALSLSWVVILFIFFPRISFEHASYGFKQDSIAIRAHDGTMYVDDKAQEVPSEKIVMEVSFLDGVIPPANKLYFRGTVLYNYLDNHWERLPANLRKNQRVYLQKQDNLVSYKVALYPTKQNWLYMIDLPIELPRGASGDADFVTTLKKPIEEPLHYDGTSALEFVYAVQLEPLVHKVSLQYPQKRNPKSKIIADQIAQNYASDIEKANALVRFFEDRNFTYTLQPSKMDSNNSVDSFLFETQKGYCVHFASSFVLMARMAGIPARVVTGFKANPNNSIENYIIIKEKDAHAWAELYLSGRWMRYETTAFARHYEQQSLAALDLQKKKNTTFFTNMNLYLMYLKYQVETWILEYSYLRQLQLIDEFKKNPLFVYKISGAFILLVLLSFLLFKYFHKNSCKNELQCVLRPLFVRLKEEGYMREEGETMHQFFSRVAALHLQSERLLKIGVLYEQILYGEKSELLNILRENIKIFLHK